MTTRRVLPEILNKFQDFNGLIYEAIFERQGDNTQYIRKFARTGNINAGVTSDLWFTAGSMTHLASAELINVVSDDADDTVAGSGARFIFIQGLDGDYNIQSELVIMSGLTPVQTTLSFLRIHRVRVLAAGSSLLNEGTITLTDATGATVQAAIPPQESITHMSHFTVPADYTAFILNIGLGIGRFSGSGSKEGEAEFIVYAEAIPGAGRVEYRISHYSLNNQGTTQLQFLLPNPVAIPQKTDMKINITSAQNNTSFLGEYHLMLIKDTTFLASSNLID